MKNRRNNPEHISKRSGSYLRAIRGRVVFPGSRLTRNEFDILDVFHLYGGAMGFAELETRMNMRSATRTLSRAKHAGILECESIKGRYGSSRWVITSLGREEFQRTLDLMDAQQVAS